MVTNGIPCSGSGLPGESVSATSSVGGGGGGLIVSGSCNEGGVSEGGGSTSPGGSVSVAAISAASSANGNGPPGPGGPSLLPVGIPFLSGLGPDPSSPFYPGHPGAGFDLKENMEAWRSIPAYASMYGGYDGAILAGYPMLRNGYGMDLNGSRRKNATRETTSTLKAWLNDHRKNPYPTKAEKIMLAIITQMTLTQVSTWFANARRRLKKENKMTWSPRNRCDDDDDDCKEGGFNSSTDTRDVDGTPLGSVNHHRSASSLHSNGGKDLVEPDSDIDIDDDDSSSDNLIDKKRFKRNESPLSDSGGSGITISATSALGEHHHPLHPSHLHGHPGLHSHHLHRTHPLLHPLSQQQLQHLSSLSSLNHPLAHHHLSSYNSHLTSGANNHPLLHHHHSSHHPLSLHHPTPFTPNGNTIGSANNNSNDGNNSNSVNNSATTSNSNLLRCKMEPLSPSIPPISLSSSPSSSSSTSSSPSSSTLSSSTATTTTITVNHNNRTNSNHHGSSSDHQDRVNSLINHHHHHHHPHHPHHNQHHSSHQHHLINNNQSHPGIQNATLPPTSKPRIWSIVDTAISNTNTNPSNTNNSTNNSTTTPVSTSSSPPSSAISTTPTTTPTSKSSPKSTPSSTPSTATTTTTTTTSSSPENVYHFNL